MKLELLAAAMAAFFAAGCETMSTSGLEVAVGEGGMGTIRVDDRSLSRNVLVERGIVRREDSGFAKVQVFVRNTCRNDLPIQYKFRFFDVDGMEVMPGERAWEQTVLHGDDGASLSAVAPKKEVVKFSVRIRRVMNGEY